ncbi:hypothetical protein CHS0354_010430 [Potamilus streckersoni]|uniref:Uncharacterized protein n=1 Tax=Potamilus streckersoni TaxID=2493646 RepID=A0AAE0SLN4_9BIVA|nr:hypothetical protein CHS0354_010430 [Potamilus streckersoni]
MGLARTAHKLAQPSKTGKNETRNPPLRHPLVGKGGTKKERLWPTGKHKRRTPMETDKNLTTWKRLERANAQQPPNKKRENGESLCDGPKKKRGNPELRKGKKKLTFCPTKKVVPTEAKGGQSNLWRAKGGTANKRKGEIVTLCRKRAKGRPFRGHNPTRQRRQKGGTKWKSLWTKTTGVPELEGGKNGKNPLERKKPLGKIPKGV